MSKRNRKRSRKHRAQSHERERERESWQSPDMLERMTGIVSDDGGGLDELQEREVDNIQRARLFAKDAVKYTDDTGEAYNPGTGRVNRGPANRRKETMHWPNWDYMPLCSHRPFKLINGRSWSVWAASKEEARLARRDFDIIINCTGMAGPSREQHRLPSGLEKFVSKNRKEPEEILLDWFDGEDIDLEPEFWPALAEYLSKHRARTLVHCIGGHGRTGTAIACLMVASCNFGAHKAINWIRKHYCEEAIETMKQIWYVERVAKRLGKDKDDEPLAQEAVHATVSSVTQNQQGEIKRSPVKGGYGLYCYGCKTWNEAMDSECRGCHEPLTVLGKYKKEAEPPEGETWCGDCGAELTGKQACDSPQCPSKTQTTQTGEAGEAGETGEYLSLWMCQNETCKTVNQSAFWKPSTEVGTAGEKYIDAVAPDRCISCGVPSNFTFLRWGPLPKQERQESEKPQEPQEPVTSQEPAKLPEAHDPDASGRGEGKFVCASCGRRSRMAAKCECGYGGAWVFEG